jgi:putative two-component system response regulator
MRVLLVDDDRISVEMLANTLLETQFEVTIAGSAPEALTILEAEEHSIVVTDWNMPGMSGVDLVRRIRQMAADHYVYVIVLTSRDSSADICHGLEAGADDYIVKPFNPAELIMRLRAGQRVVGQQTRDLTIFALAKLAESRDPETGAHLERIRDYCRILSEGCRDAGVYSRTIDRQFTNLIYETSPLHDIGKVGIPDTILLKPGRLSQDEFETMKTHTLVGYNTLQAAAEKSPGVAYLEMACQIARSHHERWDGSGYPDGLVGGNIPLAARVVAIADVYDALTSRRVYKSAFSSSVAENIIADGHGKHFDPQLVAVFSSVADRFADVRQRQPDPVMS